MLETGEEKSFREMDLEKKNPTCMKAKRMERLIKCYSVSYISCRNRSREKRQKSNGLKERKKCHKITTLRIHLLWRRNQMVESFSYINCNFPSTHIAPVWYTFYLLHFLHFTFSFMHWHFLYIWCFLQPYIVQIVHCPEDHRPKTLLLLLGKSLLLLVIDVVLNVLLP